MLLKKVPMFCLLIMTLVPTIQFVSGLNAECLSVIRDVHKNQTRENQKYDAVMDMFTILLKERKRCKCVEKYLQQLQDRKRILVNADVKIDDEVKRCKQKTMDDIDISSFGIFHGKIMGRKYEAVMDMLTMLLEDRKSCDCFRRLARKLKKELEDMGKGVNKRADCRQLYLSGKKKNGVYKINANKKEMFNVYCDMANGGWTVIQRRVKGAVSFDRSWLQNANGFGDLRGDHWLGLKYVNQITSLPNRSYDLMFNLVVNGNRATAVYENFRIGDAISKFTLHIDGTVKYSSEMLKCTNNNAFYYQNGSKFTTKDSDNDNYKTNCAHHY